MKRVLCIFIFLFIFTASFVHAEEMEVFDKVDFEDLQTGSVDGSDFAVLWDFSNPAGNTPLIRDEGGNKYLRMDGYSQIISPHIMESDEYVFETKIRLTYGYRWVGFFVRAANPVLRTNPYHSEYSESNPIGMHIHFYESDWYYDAEQKGESNMGGSGIGIFPRKGHVRVAIKTYIPNALNMGIVYHDFPYPEDTNPKEFVKYTVRDNGTDTIEIYINDHFITKITFSEPVVYEEDPHDENEYYSVASMTDLEGNVFDLYDQEDRKIEILDNARIAVFSHRIAFASRTQSFDIDDIVFYHKASQNTLQPTQSPDRTNENPVNRTPDNTVVNDNQLNYPAILITTSSAIVTVIFISYMIILFRKTYRR